MTRIRRRRNSGRTTPWLAMAAVAVIVPPCWCSARSVRKSAAPPPALAATQPAAGPMVWLDSLDDAYKDAAKHQRPILVVLGAEWCAPCRELQKELTRDEVTAALSGWTCARLDVDKPDPAMPRYTGAIPALRILTPEGKPIDNREGYVTGAELIKWLETNSPKAMAAADPDLIAPGAPDRDAIGRLLTKLAGRDGSAREAATRRLTPYPQAAAEPVVAAFADGPLRTRLAVLELLRAWEAPVAGLDPWKPQTIDAAKLDALKKWATGAAAAPATTRPATPGVPSDARRELTALLQAPDPAAAHVIADRLARIGPSLAPMIVEQLKLASADRDRQRLTALRYQLAASEALNLNWTGGIDRLASTDPPTRRTAAEELTKRATAEDAALLLQLFNDADPLVREISLRGIQAIDGKSSSGALVKLLKDPEPNVRAAVLKFMADDPKSAMVEPIVAFVATERDSDLIVHAVRVLRTAHGEAAEKCLLGLTDHASWRVRAEAIDALAEIQNPRSNASPTIDAEAFQAAMIRRLDDPDGFVAGRAIAAFQTMNRLANIPQMIEASQRHPDLAKDVVHALSLEIRNTNQNNAKAIDALRNFCSHSDAAVRAAAIAGLAEGLHNDSGPEIKKGLSDPKVEVRVAAAHALFFQVIENTRPQNWIVEKSGFFGFGGGQSKIEPAVWVEEYRKGKRRPKWMEELSPLLHKMLSSDDGGEREAAVFPLVTMGSEADALPVALAIAKNDAAARDTFCWLLPWLPFDQRSKLFDDILALGANDSIIEHLAERTAIVKDPHDAEHLWQLLNRGDGNRAVAGVYTALKMIYTGADEYGGGGNPSGNGGDADSKSAVDVAKSKAASGNESQRFVGLALLLAISDKDAAELAGPARSDVKGSKEFRADALRILLLAQPRADADKVAVETLSSESVEQKQLALTFLAEGKNSIHFAHERVYLTFNQTIEDSEGVVYSGEPKAPHLADGLKPELLTPFLNNPDADMAARAGYLLCLLKQKDGLAPLVRRWRSESDNEREWRRLLYRGIGALDDDAQTTVLEQIYAQFEKRDYYIRDFYWSIRSMHGPHILALRKKIRDEVGMDRLR